MARRHAFLTRRRAEIGAQGEAQAESAKRRHKGGKVSR
jgi:hypothetical protein